MNDSFKGKIKRSELWLLATPLLVFGAFAVAVQFRRTPAQKRTPVTRRPFPVATRPPRTWPGHFGGVWDLTFAPDGKSLLSSGGGNYTQPSDCNVMLWSVKDSRLQPRLKITGLAKPGRGIGGRGHVHSVAFSPDGKWFALGAENRLVELRESKTGKIIRTLTSDFKVLTIAISPDGRWLAAGGGIGNEGGLVVWDCKTGKTQWEVSAWLHDKKRVYNPGREYFGVNPAVQSIAFSPDSKTLVSVASYYGERGGSSGLHLWEATTGKLKMWLPDGKDGYAQTPFESYAVAFSGDGKTVAVNRLGVSIQRGGVTLFDAHTGNEIKQILCDVDITDMTFSHDGKRIAAGGGLTDLFSIKASQFNAPHGKVFLWDIAKKTPLKTWTTRDCVSAVTLSPSDSSLAVATSRMDWGEVKIFPISGRKSPN